jgi:hypothetical protein
MAVETNDITVLIPRVRRAVEGPMASGSASLSDTELRTIVADAISNVIFFSEGAFAHTLDVTARDEQYGAPTAWTINPPLDEAEASVIAAQAALDYFFFSLRDLKTQETIKDEGSEWSYSLSATLLRDQINLLRAMRDKALEALEAEADVGTTAYFSFIQVRDSSTSSLIEDYL